PPTSTPRLSLHDALPICHQSTARGGRGGHRPGGGAAYVELAPTVRVFTRGVPDRTVGPGLRDGRRHDPLLPGQGPARRPAPRGPDRKSTRLNSSHVSISY